MKNEFKEAFWEGVWDSLRLSRAILMAIPLTLLAFVKRTGEWERRDRTAATSSASESAVGRQLGRAPWRR